MFDDIDFDTFDAPETDFDAELRVADEEALAGPTIGRQLNVMEVIGVHGRRGQEGVEVVDRIEQPYGYDLVIADNGRTFVLSYDGSNEPLGLGTEL